MGAPLRCYYKICLAVVLVMLISSIAVRSFPGAQQPSSTDVPVLKGGAGSCTADFVVSDTTGKRIYDAKIAIQVKYGFMGLHRLDLTVGTNFEGKARIEGLPEQIKGSGEFKVSHGEQSKFVAYDPQENCHSQNKVILGEK